MSTYKPINCDFHSVLESFAVKKTMSLIEYKDAQGEQQLVETTIDDLYTLKGEEFAVLGTKLILRLDQIMSIKEKGE